MGEQINETFLTNVAGILEQARQNAKAAIDLSMVYAYFEIGKLIVEEEQSGGQRAAYGKYVIPELSKYLTAHLGRGFSVTNLKQMRKFYQVYAENQIGQTLSDQFSNLPAVSTGRKFPLSWSIADRLMVSRKTVSQKIKGLKDKGIISRVGSAKKGHWKRI